MRIEILKGNNYFLRKKKIRMGLDQVQQTGHKDF